MSDIAIRVENLSKQYRIGGPQARYKTLREGLTQTIASPFRRLSSVLRGQASNNGREIFWALNEVSFEVKHGEVVGIIGRNGAGKTTLLKIISRITEPADGTVDIYGRVGSLLEVGTGFHPELSGRENIYLNGAILGMKSHEIDHKFDEIVDFAEIEKFIETPVKHYSSGMYLRLAFAVSAHLEQDILLVDEVLAVGDSDFQKKCLTKMGDVAIQGRTVLFVSHNMNAIRKLCPRTLLLSNGYLKSDDNSESVIREHLSLNYGVRRSFRLFPKDNTKIAQFTWAGFCFNNGSAIDRPIHEDDDFYLQMDISVKKLIADLRAVFYLRNQFGDIVFFFRIFVIMPNH